jgi:hypothetical protein
MPTTCTPKKHRYTFLASGGDRPWCIVAGAALSQTSFDPQILARLRWTNKAPSNPDALFQRQSAPLSLLGGYRFERQALAETGYLMA